MTAYAAIGCCCTEARELSRACDRAVRVAD